MEEKKPGRLSVFNAILITLVLPMGLFLLIESLFIVVEGNMLPDLRPSLANKVAVIYVEGEMITDNVPASFGYASSSAITKSLRDAQDDRNVRAIVLRVNSPGGTPVAAQEIYGQVLKTKKVKPVVVSMGDMATSAAYYISAPCSMIIASPDTFTGSIGAIWIFENRSGQYSKDGVEFFVAKSGPYKDIGADWRGLTDEEKAYVQAVVDEAFQRFVDAVAGGRHMDRATVEGLADGRVYTGQRALELGLVDEIGGLYDAIDAAAKLGNIPGKPDVAYMNEPTVYNLLFGSQAKDNATPAQMPVHDGYYSPYYSPYGRIYY